MNQRDWFEVGVRLIGVWCLVDRSIPWIYTAFYSNVWPDQLSRYLSEQYTTHYSAVTAAVETVVALALLFRADLLSKLVFAPRATTTDNSESDAPTESPPAGPA